MHAEVLLQKYPDLPRKMRETIFHLLGFRRPRWADNHLVVSRRAYDLSGPGEIMFT